MKRVALSLLVFGLAAMIGVSPAQAQEQDVVVQSERLPLDGQAIELGGDNTSRRVILRGTVTSRLDGSSYDAFTRVSSDRRVVLPDGPFVILPEGSTIVSEDREVARYEIQLESAGPFSIAFNPAPIAARNLVTFSEAADSLSGAIEVEVYGAPVAPEPAIIAGQGRVAEPEKKPSRVALMVGAALVIPFVFFMVLMRRRPNKSEEHLLLARARVANRGIDDEQRRLGPAFADVATASDELLEQAVALTKSVKAIDDGLARSKQYDNSDGAARQREQLQNDRATTVERIRAIAERLEETATQLVAQVAGQAQPGGIEASLDQLKGEIKTAIDAEQEARAL